MHIGMIYGEPRPFPRDIRVQKEIKSLCDAGHRVTVLARRIPASVPDRHIRISNQLSIFREDVPAWTLPERIDWYLTLRQRPWLPVLDRFIREQQPDILHVHDLIILPSVLKIVSCFGIPVVADLHENMPAAWRAYRSDFPPLRRLLEAVLLNYHHWRRHEARALRRCIHCIVVVPEAAERLLGYGIPAGRITVVSNTEDETSFSSSPSNLDTDILKKYRTYWTALYIGGIEPHRGIDTAIRAAVEAAAGIEKFRLLVVGAKPKAQEKLRSLAESLGADGNVEIVGWVPFHKVASYIHASRVCLVPHNDFEHTQTTVPHKLFQYMISGKPVLVSSCRPLARIVEETRSGMVFEAGNARSMAHMLIRMYNNPKDCRIMAQAGRRAAADTYSWRRDGRRLVDMYAMLNENVSKRYHRCL